MHRFPHLWAGASCFNHHADTRGGSLGAETRLPGSAFDADSASPLRVAPSAREPHVRDRFLQAAIFAGVVAEAGVPVNRRHSPRPGRTYPYRLYLGGAERAVGLNGKTNFYWAYPKTKQTLQNAGPGYKPG